MTVLTGGKLPYPLPNEPLALVADNIKALAQALDAQKAVAITANMNGATLAASAIGTLLGATTIPAASHPRTVQIVASTMVSVGQADVLVRQDTVELKRSRASANNSAVVVTTLDLAAGVGTSINVQAIAGAAGATLSSDVRWAHVDILVLAKMVIA